MIRVDINRVTLLITYKKICFEKASAVANDITEAEHLFKYTSMVKEYEDQKKYGDAPGRYKSDHIKRYIYMW